MGLGEPGKMDMELQYNSDTMTLCMWRVIHIYIDVGVMPHSINHVELKWGVDRGSDKDPVGPSENLLLGPKA